MHGIISRPFAGDFGCPEEWETWRAMFRTDPSSEKFAIEAYETFRINIFQMEEHNPAFLTRKTYYIRGHRWSDMMASLGKVLIDHPLGITSRQAKPLLNQLRPLMDCPRLFQVTVRIVVAKHDQDPDLRRRPRYPYYKLDTTKTTLGATMQVCWELRDKDRRRVDIGNQRPTCREKDQGLGTVYEGLSGSPREDGPQTEVGPLSSPSRGFLHLQKSATPSLRSKASQ